MSQRTPVETVTEFMRAFERFEFDSMPALLADDVELRIPTAPAGIEREHVGKDAFVVFINQIKLVWQSLSFVKLDVHAFADDPAKVVAVYTSDGKNADGSRYQNNYVSLVEVVDGRITVFEEYFDPAPLANALSLLAAQSN